MSWVLMLSAPAQTPSTEVPKALSGTSENTTSPAQEPAAPAPPTWSVGPIDFSGLVDGYYSFNSNHPASQVNQLYNFNDKTNQFSLNMAKLSLAHTPDPVGFQVDLGFGRAFEIFNRQPSERASDTFRFLEQAYLSIKPPKAKGLEVDFGKFVTSAGAEVLENNDTSKGWRHLYDTTVVFTPSTKVNGYINFDYGQNANFSLVSGIAVPGVPPLSKWYGLAGALHLQANSHWSFTPRVEWFKDKDGFATGVAQDLKECTFAGEDKMVEGLLARLEYRRDWTNQPFVGYGGGLGSKKSQQ